MSSPHILSEIISKDVSLNLVEPHIYSVYSTGASPGSYDSIDVSTIYGVVACNRVYNWIMWGYSIKDYATLCEKSLASSSIEFVTGSRMRLLGVYSRNLCKFFESVCNISGSVTEAIAKRQIPIGKTKRKYI